MHFISEWFIRLNASEPPHKYKYVHFSRKASSQNSYQHPLTSCILIYADSVSISGSKLQTLLTIIIAEMKQKTTFYFLPQF